MVISKALLVVLGGMMLMRSGVFLVRIWQDVRGGYQSFVPAGEQEEQIYEHYLEVQSW